MEQEAGDDYVRRIASYIRTNERRLAELGFGRRRKRAASTPSSFNPLGWVGLADTQPTPPQPPLVFQIDTHHLFYLLMRMEALGIDIGSLDVLVDEPSRPLSYIALPEDTDNSDVLSIASFRSTVSAVSRLSLGMGWWGRPEQPGMDSELKYIFSCFTKLPALSVCAPGPRVISELAQDPPGNNAIPLESFKNLQSLECLDTDPRALLGWDKLAESLLSLTIKRSGVDDPTSVFVDAVLDDQLRRGGDASRSRQRRLGHYSPKGNGARTPAVPETVHEHEEEEIEDTPRLLEHTIPLMSPPLPAQLSPLKWSRLRHLSLADNALTSVPSTLFTLLSSLTHLDLSSNLLVSIPTGLSALYNLVSLDLSDNMIDSVLGIYTKLGQVLTLNLSKNRLESICGLERLMALERVDLRRNLLDESAEVGRISVLPNIAEVWIEGNPFVTLEENYRVRCFDYFRKEGKQILLDGSPPGFYERRGLTAAPVEQSKPLRPPPPTPYSPAVTPSQSAPEASRSSPNLLPSPATTASHPSPALTGVTPKAKRRRNKRIIALDGADSDYRSSEDGGRLHSRQVSEAVAKPKAAPPQPTQLVSVQAQAATILSTPLSAEPEEESIEVRPPTPEDSLPASTSAPAPTPTSTQPDASSSSFTPPKRPSVSRHSRHHTEFTPSFSRSSTSMAALNPPSSSSDINNTSTSPNGNGTITSSSTTGTLSNKSSKRRNRVSASVYEPSSPSRDAASVHSGPDKPGHAHNVAAAQLRDASAFRAKIEALRAEMGDNWLQVLSQSQFVQGVGGEAGKRG